MSNQHKIQKKNSTEKYKVALGKPGVYNLSTEGILNLKFKMWL